MVVLFSTCFLWVHASFAQDKTNALPGNADQKVYEAIGVMISHGSGLHKMGFDSTQQKAILKGLAKGFNLDTIPPEIQSLQPKIQEIMMKKMQAVREAAQADQAKSAQVNKEKGHNRPDQTTASFLRPRRQEDGVAEDRADDHNQKCR